MEQAIMKKVLEEILDEQRISNADKQQLTETLNRLTEEITSFNRKLMTIKLTTPDVNTSTFESLLNTHVNTMQLTQNIYFRQLEAIQKKKKTKEQIFYWLPWLIVMLLCAIIFRIALGGHFYGTIF